MRGAGYSSIAISYALGIPQELDRHLSHAVPHLPPPVAEPHLVERILEIRSLPPMYPADARHLERTALQSAAPDVLIAAARSEAVSLRTLPLQFRQLSSPPRAGGAEAPERCDGLISLRLCERSMQAVPNPPLRSDRGHAAATGGPPGVPDDRTPGKIPSRCATLPRGTARSREQRRQRFLLTPIA